MIIDNRIIKHYLKNVMFINGTAYAGKSTMVKMLADKFDLICCGENYDCVPKGMITPETHPNLCYFQTMRGWQEFINRTPKEYNDWIAGCTQELIEFEITYLMSISQAQKVVVDTNLPADILREIAGYNQVAVMICPPQMSIEHFFERDDTDKVFIKEQLMKSDNPEKTTENYRAILKYVAYDSYKQWENSGFFTLNRKDVEIDTRQETMEILAKHFRLL
jgi:dephospho-CoA kinase